MPQNPILNLEPTYAIDAAQQIAFKLKMPPPAEVRRVRVLLDDTSLLVELWAPQGVWDQIKPTSLADVSMATDGVTLSVTLKDMPPPGRHTISVERFTNEKDTEPAGTEAQSFKVIRQQDLGEIVAERGSLPVSLQARAAARVPSEEVHWIRVLAASQALGYDAYRDYVKENFCKNDPAQQAGGSRRSWGGVRAYERLKEVTEHFVQDTCERIPASFVSRAVEEALGRLERNPAGDMADLHRTVPDNLTAARRRLPRVAEAYEIACLKETSWCPVELIWSCWQEAGMLVQTMNVIARRFQNLRVGHGRDPLANFEIAPLRALNHLLFGYVQDDNRLTVLRRAYEYEHEYGLHLPGKAVRQLRPADRRTKFIESFHNLLLRCTQFYRQHDDLTVRADAYPVLSAIKELHYLIAQGHHNQMGDLPQLARQEMLLEQWLLGRTEMRDFLRARDMVPYPEDWMDRVDAMKNIQGWLDTSVIHFRDLAISSEVLVLSVRYGGWASQTDAEVASTWATLFRAHIQTYLHAYRAVTGVDLTGDTSHPRQAMLRAASPSEHLQRRLAEQSARPFR